MVGMVGVVGGVTVSAFCVIEGEDASGVRLGALADSWICGAAERALGMSCERAGGPVRENFGMWVRVWVCMQR